MPLKSYHVSWVCFCPLKTVVSITVNTFALCVIVEVYSALAIIPMFLLFPALKTHVPEKSGGFAAAVANATATKSKAILRIIWFSPFDRIVAVSQALRLKSGLSSRFSELCCVL